VRKAINYAIDLDTIIKTVLEATASRSACRSKRRRSLQSGHQVVGLRPERAKALLREAGYANGFEMTCMRPTVAT